MGEVDVSAPIVVPIGEQALVEGDIPFHETPEGSLNLDVYRSRMAEDDRSRPGILKHLEDGQLFPPTLIVRAGKDFEGLNRTIDSFVEESDHRGQDLELIRLEEAQHGFDVLDDTEASRDAIRCTVDFLQARLV